jgi:DNA-binding response OmpR family regulator
MARLFCCPGCGVEISPQHIVPGFATLTPQQQELVTVLSERPGHYVSSGELARALWAGEDKASQRNSIDVQVARIRKRLGRHVIETRKTVGYRLALRAESEYTISSPTKQE